ncbi:lectin protein kinase family protein [Salvia divinorum]|uniref:non-specific serine/threonine protein kinase n=1 Tax=Salvia divinorum TaxID=28513 RepID=A0ABD1FPG0_SALDI
MKFSFLNMVWLLFIFISAAVIIAQDILPGSKLVALDPKDSWRSPNKLFSLSFIQESTDTYFAAITCNGVPIWKAGGAVDSSAWLEFTFYGNLLLYEGYSAVWRSNTYDQGITSASLENSGEISLRWNSSVEYYTSSGINNNVNYSNMMTSPSLRLDSEGILSLNDLSSSRVIMARGSDYGEVSDQTLRFLKLDCDGNLRMYSSSVNGRGSKNVTWAAVTDQCKVFGYCGDFGVCRYDENSGNPICGCPSQSFFVTKSNGGRNTGCERKMDIRKCQTTMLPMDNTLFLTYPPETDEDSSIATAAACRSNCLNDSSCIASTFLADGTGTCYMKRSSFISGYQSPTIASKSYVKVCELATSNPPTNPPFSSKEIENRTVELLKIAVVVLGSSLVMVILGSCLMWFFCRSKPRYRSLVHHQYTCADYASSAPVQFSYKELQQETKGFKEKIGEGGFGSVYKGVLTNKMAVAVKQLEGIGQGEKQFRMEVATISSTHHLNLVRLVGFCSEGKHRLLVYEFMKNGSLDSSLFPSDGKVLNWACRYSIALGTAKGMMYLHEECRDCILHCDIKPENILLDEKYNARISDFGLARLLNLNDPRHRSLVTVRGTRGYLAPEWIANLPVTSKADVYSYGMMLLEIVSGRRNFEASPETNNRRFSLWAYEEFEKGNVGAVLDRRLVEDEIDVVQAMRLLKVSFWCIQDNASFRPTMGKVVQMLEGIADVKKPPPPLFLADGSAQSSVVISSVSSSQMAVASSLASS